MQQDRRDLGQTRAEPAASAIGLSLTGSNTVHVHAIVWSISPQNIQEDMQLV